MDALWFLDRLWILFAAVGGWLLKSIWTAVQELKQDLHELEVDLPKSYVSKVDLAPLLADIKSALQRIETRLDEKADK